MRTILFAAAGLFLIRARLQVPFLEVVPFGADRAIAPVPCFFLLFPGSLQWQLPPPLRANWERRAPPDAPFAQRTVPLNIF